MKPAPVTAIEPSSAYVGAAQSHSRMARAEAADRLREPRFGEPLVAQHSVADVVRGDARPAAVREAGARGDRDDLDRAHAAVGGDARGRGQDRLLALGEMANHVLGAAIGHANE